MKTEEQIKRKIKEKGIALATQKYTTYSEKRTLTNWIKILSWVLQ